MAMRCEYCGYELDDDVFCPACGERQIGDTPLMQAVRKNDINIMKRLIADGENIEARNNDGQTALMVAAHNNASKATEVLIKAGANIEKKDNIFRTALMWAAIKNAPETAEVLIKAKADIEKKDDNGCTAFMLACFYGSKETARVLMRYGARVQVKNCRHNQFDYQAVNPSSCEIKNSKKGTNFNKQSRKRVVTANVKNNYEHTSLMSGTYKNVRVIDELMEIYNSLGLWGDDEQESVRVDSDNLYYEEALRTFLTAIPSKRGD